MTKPLWEQDAPTSDPKAAGRAPAASGPIAHTARLAELGLMAGALIHELKQPLLGIKGYTQVLAESPLSEVKDKAALILAQVRRLEEAIERYRRFLRVDAAEVRHVSVASAVAEALKIVEPRLRAGGLQVTTAVPADLPAVNAVEGQVVQVLVNLVANACDALASAAIRTIRVQARREGGWVSVFVADHGPGISRDVAGKLFTAFYTTKPAETGTGLGLYVSRSIAEAHGGTLELVGPESIEAASAQGPDPLVHPGAPPPSTVFRLRLPIADRSGASRASVLVVDDEEIVLNLMRDLLVPDGVEVATARTGDEGAAMLSARRFDLLITDKNLPGASGLELARLARQRHPECAVIVMTAYPSLESAQEGLAIGLLDYLEKPFPDIGEVRRKVREVLRGTRDRAEPKRPAEPSTRRILVVEDQDAFAPALLEAVALAGGMPVRATSIGEAQRIATEAPLAGVILSLELRDPALGPKAIRELKRPGNVPLLALQDAPSFEGTIAAIRMGAAACLPRALATAKALAKELPRFFYLPKT